MIEIIYDGNDELMIKAMMDDLFKWDLLCNESILIKLAKIFLAITQF